MPASRVCHLHVPPPPLTGTAHTRMCVHTQMLHPARPLPPSSNIPTHMRVLSAPTHKEKPTDCVGLNPHPATPTAARAHLVDVLHCQRHCTVHLLLRGEAADAKANGGVGLR